MQLCRYCYFTVILWRVAQDNDPFRSLHRSVHRFLVVFIVCRHAAAAAAAAAARILLLLACARGIGSNHPPLPLLLLKNR